MDKSREMQIVLTKLWRNSGIGLDKLPGLIQELEIAIENKIRNVMVTFSTNLVNEMVKKGMLVVPSQEKAPSTEKPAEEGADLSPEPIEPEKPQNEAVSEVSEAPAQ